MNSSSLDWSRLSVAQFMRAAPLDIRPPAFVIGILLLVLSFCMLVPLSIAVYLDEPHIEGFATGIFLSLFIGGLCILSFRTQELPKLQIRSAFFLTTALWCVLGAFSALPFWYTLRLTVASAVFESVSALTTTGLSHFDFNAPLSLIVWRSILHWLGGIGITLMALTLLPFLRVGGLQLFSTESSSHYEKILPKISQITKWLLGVYLSMTILCIGLLWVCGMSKLHAFCYGVSAVSTSGLSMFTNYGNYLGDPWIPWILIVFMILSASPLLLFVKFLTSGRSVYFQDSQVQAYLKLIALCTLFVWCMRFLSSNISDFENFKTSLFQTASMITTAGFDAYEPSHWAPGLQVFLVSLCVVGGCTGSTSGGIKIFRFQIIYRTLRTQCYKMVIPHGMFRPMYRNQPVEEHTVYAVLTLMTLYVLFYVIFTITLILSGLGVTQGFELSANLLSNCGAHFFHFHPEKLSNGIKWIMSLGMLLGRLEFLTVLVLFTPIFWRR